jgi:hypothetical protein
VAFVVIVFMFGAFGAAIPFADTPLQRLDSFIPTVMAIIFVTDLVAAVLLFGQFSATGSRALLVLACGYLFSSLIVISHALTYPGAFSPTGLLGAGPYGLKRNVIERYKFICRNYEPGADIFLFGCSRGAFTVRVLADWILSQGLAAYGDDEAKLSRLVIASYRTYRKEKYSTISRVEVPFRILRDIILRTPYSEVHKLHRPSIRFVGV